MNKNILANQCQSKLLKEKALLLNQMKNRNEEQSEIDFKGDEMDQTSLIQMENQFIIHQTRVRNKLLEIERALGKIENGAYGICEITQEPIEKERLLALPWTRLSIEGAEILEAKQKKHYL